MVLVKKFIWFCCFDLWLLITAINKPHLIDRKDEADGYKGAIQTEWPKFYSIRRSRYCNGVKHGKILKQQRQPRQVARALVGKLMTRSF